MPKPAVNPSTIYSGSSDSTRYPGFRSADNDSGVVSVPGASSAAPVASAEPTLSPGMLAAQNASPNRKSAIGTILGGVGFNTLTGGLFRHNASPLQDIAGALALGRPVSDASWASAGYGPGGAALSPTTAPPATTSLSRITAAPVSATPVDPSLQSANPRSGLFNYSAAFPLR